MLTAGAEALWCVCLPLVVYLYIFPYWLRHNQDKRCSSVPSPWRVSDINRLPLRLVYSAETLKRQFAFFPSEGIQTCASRLLHVLHLCYDNFRCLNRVQMQPVDSRAFADVTHLPSYKVNPCSSQVSAHVLAPAVMLPCLLSLGARCDWFRHKSVLSSHPLKLWSHRYVCAAIAVRGTELFTSSSFSYSLPADVTLYPFFLALLISSRSIHTLCLIPTFFHPPVLALSCLFSPLPHSASSLPPLTSLLFLTPPPSPSPCHSFSTSLHSISLQYCQPSGDSQPSLLFIY